MEIEDKYLVHECRDGELYIVEVDKDIEDDWAGDDLEDGLSSGGYVECWETPTESGDSYIAMQCQVWRKDDPVHVARFFIALTDALHQDIIIAKGLKNYIDLVKYLKPILNIQIRQ